MDRPWTGVALMLAVAPVAAAPAVAQGDRPAARATIEGVVLDAGGAPLPACRVDLRRWGQDPEVLATTRTDGEGRFVFSRSLERASYAVQVVAPGRVAVAELASVSASRPTRVLTIRAWDAGTIRGRVVDADDAPIAGAEVIAAQDEARVFAFDSQARAISAADGSFELTTVALGWNQVRAWKPGAALAEESVWLRDAAEMTLRLDPAGAGRMELHVEGLPDGVAATFLLLPYANGSHRVLPEGMRRGRVTTTTPWVCTGLPPFEFRVRLTADGYVFAPDQWRFDPGQDPHHAVFRATPAPVGADAAAGGGTRVRGTLRHADGRPLAGEKLACRLPQGGRTSEAVTDAEGRFDCVAPVAAGTACVLYLVDSDHVLAQEKTGRLLGATDARFRSQHEFVIDADAELDVRAIAAARVSGRVVDAEGAAVRWRRVELQEARPNRHPEWARFAFVETDADGRFRFRGLNPPPDRELRVAAGARGAIVGTSGTFALRHGETRSGVDFEIAPTAAITGRIVDAAGEPVPGARVWLLDGDLATGQPSGGSVEEILADRDGRFGFPDVAPGGHWVQVRLQGREVAFSSVVFEVRGGETVDLPIRLERRM